MSEYIGVISITEVIGMVGGALVFGLVAGAMIALWFLTRPEKK